MIQKNTILNPSVPLAPSKDSTLFLTYSKSLKVHRRDPLRNIGTYNTHYWSINTTSPAHWSPPSQLIGRAVGGRSSLKAVVLEVVQ